MLEGAQRKEKKRKEKKRKEKKRKERYAQVVSENPSAFRQHPVLRLALLF